MEGARHINAVSSSLLEELLNLTSKARLLEKNDVKMVCSCQSGRQYRLCLDIYIYICIYIICNNEIQYVCILHIILQIVVCVMSS